ncbi:MarR family transcriptional regulator [Belnapia mucosa]|uniref:MarR family transcriptional regulator n=1 Tax=Belnapia mucosa TaxID=2804532 RepID=UPI002E2B85CF|nr:MarR family transcriptional regulator [Belnapia mucosa]
MNLRQLAVLLVVYQTNEPQTVRGLAKHLKVNKPAITRALDRLEEFELAVRHIDPKDRRSVVVRRTPLGTAMVERLKMAMAEATTVEDQ